MENKIKFNHSDIVDVTKQVLEYSEERRNCEYCKFSKEENDMAGGWYTQCTYSNICHFSVAPHGTCKKFEQKTKK
jgi:hypothetical protein